MDNKITYEQIFNTTSNGAVVTDASGNIVYINRQLARLLLVLLRHHNEIICFPPIKGVFYEPFNK